LLWFWFEGSISAARWLSDVPTALNKNPHRVSLADAPKPFFPPTFYKWVERGIGRRRMVADDG